MNTRKKINFIDNIRQRNSKKAFSPCKRTYGAFRGSSDEVFNVLNAQ